MDGKITPNAFLIGRTIVLKHIEILLLTGYLEGGNLLSETNNKFKHDMDYVTRGVRYPSFAV